MNDDGALDLPTLDRRLSRSQPRIEAELARLRQPDAEPGPSADARGFDEDFGGLRDLAGQSTYRAVLALAATGPGAEHRAGMLRWIYELLQLRVAWDLVVDDVEAMRAVDPALAARSVNQAPRENGEHEGGPARSYADAFRDLVLAAEPAAANVALSRLGDLAAPVAATRKELRSRRFEVASRLGLPHPWELAAGGGAAALDALATLVLDATEPLAVELLRATRSAPGDASLPARTIAAAFARDAGEGWPSTLTSRFYGEAFRTLTSRAPKMVRAPRPLGAASFLRGAAEWGALLRFAGTARSLPFALARDPYPTDAHRFGGVLALAVADAVFARKKLGLSRRAADAHRRALARTLFLSLRVLAAQVRLGRTSAPDPDATEELGARVFGAPLPRSLGAVWSYGGLVGALPVDRPARLVGATSAHALALELVARFDEDWFDNPRAGAFVAATSAGPVFRADVPEPAAIAAIARAFEATLG